MYGANTVAIYIPETLHWRVMHQASAQRSTADGGCTESGCDSAMPRCTYWHPSCDWMGMGRFDAAQGAQCAEEYARYMLQFLMHYRTHILDKKT